MIKSETPEYRAWESMRRRCDKPNAHNYRYYGGRGIGYAEDWKSFDNFLRDVGKKPGAAYSLDRIDNDKDYSPENCRWATKTEQQRNSSNSRLSDQGRVLILSAPSTVTNVELAKLT